MSNLQKEFIHYELAVKLKELGFDEPCFGYWNIDPQLKTPAFNMVKPFEHDWCLPAPTFSQVFRWFREKGFICHVTNDLSNNLQDEVYVYVMTKGYGSLIDRSEEYSTYEEAELACIDKLLEIVETK